MKIRCAHCDELVESSPRQLSCSRTGRTFAVAGADFLIKPERPALE
jgi:hypothetical protein